MNFTLIYGKSGSGKTAYIFNKIHQIIENAESELEEKVFLIVPEQSNLMAEYNLMKALNKSTLMNVEVLTLSRMQARLEQELSQNKYIHLTKIGKSMLIYNLLNKYKNQLNFLGKTSKNVDTVNQMLTEFKKHNIKIEDLQNLKFDSKYQELKFNDCLLLYQEYQKKLDNKIIDENDKINLLISQIEKSDLLNNSHIFIDDFDGFTEQEYCIIDKFFNKAKSITVTATLDDIDVLTNPSNDLFYFNKLFALRLIEIAKNYGSNIEKVKLDTNLRAKTKELKALEEALSKPEKIVFNDDVNNIELTIANDIYQEIENVAKTIYYLVKNEDYKYNEIAIITDDTDKYSISARAIFNEYNIPIFIDEKKKLNQNVLMQFILSIFDIFSNNYSIDSMFLYLKSNLLNIEKEEIYKLENYCLKWGIKGNKWQKEFKYQKVSAEQNKIEELRQKIINPLNKLKEQIVEDKTINQKIKALYEFLQEQDVISKLNNSINDSNEQLVDEYLTSYNILVSIFDEMILLFNDEVVGFDRFKELLKIGLESSELGMVPASQDQVILGDIMRSRNHNIKVIFIVGLNDGTFPKASREEGFINDNDRKFLRENGLSVAKDSMELLCNEQYNIYKAFTIATNRIYLSYCSSNIKGDSIRPSITIKKIKMLFPKLQEKSLLIEKDDRIVNEQVTKEIVLEKYKDFLDGKEIEDKWIDLICYYSKKEPVQFEKILNGYDYTNLATDITPENIQKLYGNTLKISVSKLEKYKQCPFSFYLEYGLKIKEREQMQVLSMDTGSFMHEVIDEFFKEADNLGIKIKEISDEQAQEIIDKVISEKLDLSKYYKLINNKKFIILTRKLKQTIKLSLKYIIESIKASDFNVLSTEIEFGNNKEIKPYVIELEDGKKAELEGKIDRVDIGNLDDKTCIRIIDYKSSMKSLDEKKIMAGLQLQLFTYANVMEEEKGYDPVGVFYFGLEDILIGLSKGNPSIEEIEEKIKNHFKMSGFVVADVNVVRAMDNTIPASGGSSQIIPARIDSSNIVKPTKSGPKTKEQFQELQAITKEIAKQISKEILKGKIDIKPYNDRYNTGCTYCKYGTICNFSPDRKGNNYYYI
jgi:ATP-dependent helicase/nuclease subunit B